MRDVFMLVLRYGGDGAAGKVDTDKFRARKPIGIGAGGAEGAAAARESGPVAFEKAGAGKDEEDLFGLGKFLTEVRKDKR